MLDVGQFLKNLTKKILKKWLTHDTKFFGKNQSKKFIQPFFLSNTARTLKTILPNLIKLIVNSLSSIEEDTQETAAKCLGDLVKKLGDKLLPDIIPILENDLKSDDATKRRGICNGLAEIVSSSSDEIVEEYAGSLVPTLQAALSDDDEYVQTEAGKIFDALLDKIGDRALEEIIPPIIRNIAELEDQGEDAENAMGSLRAIVNARPRQVAKYLVPKLTDPPVNTNILAFLSRQVPEVFHEHLKKIIRAVTNAMVKAKKAGNLEDYAAIRTDAQAVVASINDSSGMKLQLDELVELTRDSEKPLERIAACELFSAIAKDCPLILSQIQHQFILKNTFKFLCYDDEDLTDACWDTVVGLMARINPVNVKYDEYDLDEADDLSNNIGSIRDAVRTVNAEMKRNNIKPSVGVIGAKNRKKGFDVFWPVLKCGLGKQQADVRESTANAILDLVKIFTPASLGVSIVTIGGSLIRALSDKWSASVKSAKINCVIEILRKCPLKCVPMASQLQTILSKNLSEKDSKTRKFAAIALGELASIHRKKDLLLNEIIKEYNKSEENVNYLETFMHCIRLFLQNSGAEKINQESCQKLIGMMRNIGRSTKVKHMAAGNLGCLYALTKLEDVKSELSQAGIENCSPDLSVSTEAAFYAAAVKENFTDNQSLEKLFALTNKKTETDHVINFNMEAYAYILVQILLAKNASHKNFETDIKTTYTKIYKKIETSPDLKKYFWNCVAWAVYNCFPIQIEVDASTICLPTVQFICEAAAKAGSKSEVSNTVKKAADEAILALISQLTLEYIKENNSVNVENAIELRMNKNSVVCNPDAQICIVPVTYMNIDSSMI